MHDFVISNSLVSQIGNRTLWKDDMVSLGSPFQKPLNKDMKISPGTPFDDISIDNTYLTKDNIRYAVFLKECRIATDILLASNCLILVSDCSSCKDDWAQDSRRILSYITVCDYDTTHLQENPQRLE